MRTKLSPDQVRALLAEGRALREEIAARFDRMQRIREFADPTPRPTPAPRARDISGTSPGHE